MNEKELKEVEELKDKNVFYKDRISELKSEILVNSDTLCELQDILAEEKEKVKLAGHFLKISLESMGIFSSPSFNDSGITEFNPNSLG